MVEIAITIMFVVTYFLFPPALLVVLKLSGVDILVVNIENFVLASLLAFSYVGFLPLYLELDSYRVSSGVRADTTLVTLFLCSVWAIASFSAGLAVMRRFLPSIQASGPTGALTSGQKMMIGSAILACCAIIVSYLMRVEQIALFSAIMGNSAEATRARSEMTNDFGGGYHWYRIFMHQVLWCVTLMLWAAVLVKREWTSAGMCALAIGALVFSTAMSAQKAPVIWALLSLAFTFIVVYYNGRIRALLAIAIVGIVLAAMVAIYAMVYGGDVLSSLARVLSRALTGQIMPAAIYLEYFPKHEDFLLGRSFSNPGGLMPFEPYRLTVEITNYISPQLAEQGVVGSAPTVFWGEIYANFGYWGLAIMPFFVGLWVGLLAGMLRLLPQNPVIVGASVWLAFHLSGLASSGVFQYIIDFELVMVALTVGAISGMGFVVDRLVVAHRIGTRRS